MPIGIIESRVHLYLVRNSNLICALSEFKTIELLQNKMFNSLCVRHKVRSLLCLVGKAIISLMVDTNNKGCTRNVCFIWLY